MTLKTLLVAIPATILAGTAAMAASSPAMQPNTIDCKDWKHLPGGAWRARSYAKPFDIGAQKNIQIQDQTVSRGDIAFGNTDLAVLLDQKCGSM